MVNCRGQGMQCIFVALVALLALHSLQYPAPHHWSDSTIDTIVIEGSYLYDRIGPKIPRYVAHNELPDLISMWGESSMLMCIMT